MIRKVVFIVVILCIISSVASAQDPKERAYLYPTLSPQHKDKPKVTGWAEHRIEEKINRGMLAGWNDTGEVYIGWRLLKTDPEGITFNVYRSVDGGEAVN